MFLPSIDETRQKMYETVWDQEPIPRAEIDLSFKNTIDGSLIQAIRTGNVIDFENQLLHFSSFQINKDLNGYGTLLIQCVKSGNPAMVQMALRYGASVNLGDEQNRTPLMYAAVLNRPDMMEILVDHGADINQQVYGYGYNALHLASIQGATKAVQFLVDRGADQPVLFDGRDARDVAKNGSTWEILKQDNNQIDGTRLLLMLGEQIESSKEKQENDSARLMLMVRDRLRKFRSKNADFTAPPAP